MTPELAEAYDGLVAVVELASTLGAFPIVIEALNSRPEYRAAFDAGLQLYQSRWFDQESGRADPKVPTPSDPEPRRYHGGR